MERAQIRALAFDLVNELDNASAHMSKEDRTALVSSVTLALMGVRRITEERGEVELAESIRYFIDRYSTYWYGLEHGANS
jgi:hypothetical protein